MSDVELSEHISGWREGTGEWHLANMEKNRRANAGDALRGWLAVGISLLSMLISILAFLKN